MSVEATLGAVIRCPSFSQQGNISRYSHPPPRRNQDPLLSECRAKWEDLDFHPHRQYPPLPARVVLVDRDVTFKMKVKSSLKDKVAVELQMLCIF